MSENAEIINNKKPNIWKMVKRVLWLLLGVGTIILLGAAMQKKEQQHCIDIKIEITGTEKEMFIDEKDVIDLINTSGNIKEQKMAAVNLRALENALQKNLWIKKADLFFDNNKILHINIEEREPIARVFTAQGESFYVDSGALRLPLSDKLSARVPVFTGFPSNKKILAQPDSALLLNVTAIGKYVYADSFWMAQVSQINITPQSTFEIIPLIGNQIIVLGNADDIENKFNRLYTFYKQAWLQNGINTYSRLDVQFENQVVAVKRGKENMPIDTASINNPIVDSTSITKILKDTSHPISSTHKIKKSIIFKQPQNKETKAALSVSQKPVKPVKSKPVAATNKPKAVLNKKI